MSRALPHEPRRVWPPRRRLSSHHPIDRTARSYAEGFRHGSGLVLSTAEPLRGDSWFKFIDEEGHLDGCVWPLAEETARRIGADEIRIDIFIRQGHPAECVLNENSISSGSLYGAHALHMAKLWAEPYAAKTACVFTSDTPTHKRVGVPGSCDPNYLRTTQPRYSAKTAQELPTDLSWLPEATSC